MVCTYFVWTFVDCLHRTHVSRCVFDIFLLLRKAAMSSSSVQVANWCQKCSMLSRSLWLSSTRRWRNDGCGHYVIFVFETDTKNRE